MRQLRMAAGVAAGVCAFALGVAPALAHEFIASGEGTSRGMSASSEEEGFQKFKFGAIKITCHKATAKGHVAAGPKNTLGTSISYSQCSTEAKIGLHKIELATRFKTPVALEYHANGAVETGSEVEETEGQTKISGGEIEIKVNGGPKFKCYLHIPEQIVPGRAVKNPEGDYSAATFNEFVTEKPISKRFPSGQHKILVTNEFNVIQFSYEGEPCEEWGREGGSESHIGSYNGKLTQELVGGNLEYR